jgi:hypothetical protein
MGSSLHASQGLDKSGMEKLLAKRFKRQVIRRHISAGESALKEKRGNRE